VFLIQLVDYDNTPLLDWQVSSYADAAAVAQTQLPAIRSSIHVRYISLRFAGSAHDVRFYSQARISDPAYLLAEDYGRWQAALVGYRHGGLLLQFSPPDNGQQAVIEFRDGRWLYDQRRLFSTWEQQDEYFLTEATDEAVIATFFVYDGRPSYAVRHTHLRFV
jgi:hypothetical protein